MRECNISVTCNPAESLLRNSHFNANPVSDLLKELDWAEPMLPVVPNTEWEATVKKQMGTIPDVMTRVSGSPWLRELMLKGMRVQAKYIPKHLEEMGTLICSQENACRFCYGVARAQMKLFGYSDKLINSIEQDMLMAELDEKDRTFIRFCRNLARSKPRPSKADKEKLLSLGFSSLQVTEMAFQIARECFVNRVVTFISSPPMGAFEKLPNSFIGRLFRPIIARKLRSLGYAGDGSFEVEDGPFLPVTKALSEIPTAIIFKEGLQGAFESEVLSKELKILMFGVVARTLNCDYCSTACHNLAEDYGFDREAYNDALATLSLPGLSAQEQQLLHWTRETVHYQTGPIQSRVKELSTQVSNDKLLEAIGVASLANSVVRLAVLME